MTRKQVLCAVGVSFLLLFGLSLLPRSISSIAESGTFSEVFKKLNVKPKMVYMRFFLGRTPLMLAAASNQSASVLVLLIEGGSDVNASDSKGKTALMLAARHSSNPEVIHILMRAGADITRKSKSGKTAFDYAKKNKVLRKTDIYWELDPSNADAS